MTPNLCLCLMTAARPWTWFHHDVKAMNHLHYQSEPVPGIYLVCPDGRFLVAMKPQGKRQDNTFFKTQIAPNEHEAEVYTEEALNSQTSWTTNADASSLMTTTSCTSSSIHSAASSTSEESANHIDTSKPRKVTFVLPLPEPIRDPYHPRKSIYRKSPLRQCHSAADEPVQTPPKDPNHGRFRLFNRYDKKECPIRSIDSVGFRRLVHPLKVEYSAHLQRWMFSVELENRTVIAEVFMEDKRNHRIGTSSTKTQVSKQFTCLDDGLSWILTGDVNKNGKVKQKKGVTRDSSPLYTMTTPNTPRELTDEEAARRRTGLEINEGKFSRWKGEPKEYAMAIKYVTRRGKRR